jgi:hypothetical protein
LTIIGWIKSSLDGKITLGTYVLDQGSRAKFMVLDADSPKDFTDLIHVSSVLKSDGVPTYLETSRRGGHLWFLFDSPKPGKDVRAFGKGIFDTFKLQGLELYPKQEKAEKGPGSCIRLPFGVHRLTGKRYPFIDPDGELLASSVREQVSLLANAKTIPNDVFEGYKSYTSQNDVTPNHSGENGETTWDKIKERAPSLDFISAFVPLRRTASGGVGKCPFHDDQHDSFGVNAEGNYWNCFAGCGGGSVIDFWMKWKRIEFPQAVKELAEILGVRE